MPPKLSKIETPATSPAITALDAQISTARATLEHRERELAELAEPHATAAAATRAASLAYAEDASPVNLETHRRAKVTSTAAAASHARAEEAVAAARGALRTYQSDRARVVAAEEETARTREREAAARAALELREKETAADRAELGILVARLGRSAFMVAIEPSIAKVLRARRMLEEAVAEIRGEASAQVTRHAEALALHAEIGEPAPPAPPAPVGFPAERIAYVLAVQSLDDAYQGETAEDLTEWIKVHKFTSVDVRSQWLFAHLGFDYGPPRRHVDATTALDQLLMHGRDIGRESEGRAQLAEELAGLAALVEAHRDPVFKARAAIHELTRSLTDSRALTRGTAPAPSRRPREEQLREIIVAGAHALACWLATDKGKTSGGRYKAEGERGIVQFSGAAYHPGDPDPLESALGLLRGLPEHVTVRAFLGIIGDKTKLSHIIAPIPVSPPSPVSSAPLDAPPPPVTGLRSLPG